MELLTDFNKVAVVHIPGSGDVHFALYDEWIKEGDFVWVTRDGDPDKGLAWGQITKKAFQVKTVITKEQSIQEGHQIVDEVVCEEKCHTVIKRDGWRSKKEYNFIVDSTAYRERVKKRNIKHQIDAIIQSMDDMKKYEILAEHNSEIADLLSQYKSS